METQEESTVNNGKLETLVGGSALVQERFNIFVHRLCLMWWFLVVLEIEVQCWIASDFLRDSAI